MPQHHQKFLEGSFSNVLRVLVSVPFAFLLPLLFVHRMATAEYAAWTLMLQGSAYIGLLDLGLQTAVGKFIAEFYAKAERMGCSRIISSSFAILMVNAFIGVLAVCIVAWKVPQIFAQMPSSLVPQMRGGILLIGLSAAIALPFNAFLAAFVGLQKYVFPTVLAIVSKCLTSVALVGLILMHAGLVNLAWLMSISTIATAAAQYFGWRKYASEHMDFSIALVDRESVVRVARYGMVLSIWTVAMLLISGLDLVIVGHYDFANAGYYGIATSATNFMLLLVGSVFAPLVPAVSAMQSGRTPRQIGDMTIDATRLCTLLVSMVALPIVCGSYPLLKLWLGQDYAMHSTPFLLALIVGNVIRELGHPYALIVVATGKQSQATVAGLAEALVNVVVSIYLVQRIGAEGVAIGTVVGALVSMICHVSISMSRTRDAILISRPRFVLQGLARPLTCILPAVALIPFWSNMTVMQISPFWPIVWAVATLLIAWNIGLSAMERQRLLKAVGLKWRSTLPGL